MIERKMAEFIRRLADSYPVVTVMGPRQSGKTTLVKALFPNHVYKNLEAEDVREYACADPRAFLMNGNAPMVIDEVQRFPALLTYVQEFVDARKVKGHFILTGSHQPELNAAVAESLAGRTGICELLPLSLEELAAAGGGPFTRDDFIWRGFMPRHYDDGLDPLLLYRDYFHTYVQRDVRRLVNVQDLDTFIVFTRLLAGRVGQLLNKESLAKDVGVAVPTVTRWLNVLEASYLIFRLRPYHNNFGKRQVKAPKIYFTDVGLVAYLLGIRDVSQVSTHPLLGGLFENLAVIEALKYRLNRGLEPDMWFYRNSSGSVEVDLLLESAGILSPREIKSAFTYTRRMGAGLKAFCEIAGNVHAPLVVYSGATNEGVAVNFASSADWCVG